MCKSFAMFRCRRIGGYNAVALRLFGLIAAKSLISWPRRSNSSIHSDIITFLDGVFWRLVVVVGMP